MPIFPITQFKQPPKEIKTKYVVVICIDGVRWTEMFGDVNKTYIPNIAAIAVSGALLSDFRNNGVTTTIPGHDALVTGIYENIANDGTISPKNPSVFQEYIKYIGAVNTDAFICTSKYKLDILANTTNAAWVGTFTPSADCGTYT